jgi:hypothetical protein
LRRTLARRPDLVAEPLGPAERALLAEFPENEFPEDEFPDEAPSR